MNLAAMVDEVGRAVSASVSRSLAPITRQVEELLAWRKAVGEIQDGKDGKDAPPVDIDAVVAKVLPRIPVPKDGKDGIGKDGAPGQKGADAPPVDVDAIVAKVQSQIRVPKDGANGEDGKSPPPVDVDALVAKVLALVPTPRDGRDAAPVDTDAIAMKVMSQIVMPKNGTDGKDAPPVDIDAIVAKALARIKVPENGKDGTNGTSGNGIKRFDYDEKAHTLDIVMDNGELSTLRLPAPARGEKGEAGRDGADAPRVDEAALVAKVLALVPPPKDGAPGLRGEKGDAPSTEEVAAAITKACDALLPAMVSKHMESLMPEIITRASLLVPPGRDGLPGRPGTPGEDGRPGVSVREFDITQIHDRKQQILVELSDGSTFRKEIEFSGMVLDRDVHRPGAAYEKGDAVTHGGSYWIAKRDTSETPGKSDDWRLAVKRGRDGKDAE